MKTDFQSVQRRVVAPNHGVGEFIFIFLLFLWSMFWAAVVGFSMYLGGSEGFAAVLLGPRREIPIDVASLFQYYLSIWCYGSVIIGVWALLTRPR